MKKLVHIFLLFLFAHNLFGQDTFSIVAIDPVTREIGSAAASCVPGVTTDEFVDFLTAIIPNKGGILSQASICVPNANLANAKSQMEAGMSPTQIINYLLANDACGFETAQHRQYGIVDFDDMSNIRTAGFTGLFNTQYAEDRQGSNYSIQGNILLDVSVIDNMEANFLNTEGTLADKLMAAMQGANFPGADSRCLEDGTSSKLAYLMVYKFDDNPDDPWLRLAVPSQPPGVEPIDMLQDMYDAFLSSTDYELNRVKIYPNPVGNLMHITMPNATVWLEAAIYDVQGREVLIPLLKSYGQKQFVLDISSIDSGLYFLILNSSLGHKTIKFLKE